MTYKIIKGVLTKEHVEDEELLIIGALKSDIVKCRSLIVFGHITVRKLVMCENVLIMGNGRIYSMISKNTVLVPTTGPLSITSLKSLELIVHGKQFPVIMHEVETIRGIISHGLVNEIRAKKLILAEKTRIKNLADCVEIVFRDPLVSLENIACKPAHILFMYELIDY